MGRRKGSTAFPVARIKKMMQSDEEVGKIATVTPMLVAKALECMMELVVTEGAQVAIDRRCRTVTPLHLKSCVMRNDNFDFLRHVFDSIDGTLEPIPSREEPQQEQPQPTLQEVHGTSKDDDSNSNSRDVGGLARKRSRQKRPRSVSQGGDVLSVGRGNRIQKCPRKANSRQAASVCDDSDITNGNIDHVQPQQQQLIKPVAPISKSSDGLSSCDIGTNRPSFVNDEEEDYDEDDEDGDAMDDERQHAQDVKVANGVSSTVPCQPSKSPSSLPLPSSIQEQQQQEAEASAEAARKNSIKTAGRVSVHALVSWNHHNVS